MTFEECTKNAQNTKWVAIKTEETKYLHKHKHNKQIWTIHIFSTQFNRRCHLSDIRLITFIWRYVSLYLYFVCWTENRCQLVFLIYSANNWCTFTFISLIGTTTHKKQLHLFVSLINQTKCPTEGHIIIICGLILCCFVYSFHDCLCYKSFNWFSSLFKHRAK